MTNTVFPFLHSRNRKGRATVGVAFGSDGVALARVQAGGRDAFPELDAPGWFAASDISGVARRLEDAVAAHDLTRQRAVGVIAPGDYQVLQVEAPNVPAAEMSRAVAWRVRDLIDMPLDQAVIDTFDPPDSAQRGERHLNVVVARHSVIDERAELIKEAGLDLFALDIPELAQRNICQRLPEARGGHALLVLDPGDGLLTLYRDGELFLARTLDTGLDQLAEGNEERIDDLLLEVQRSFDYFESALAQPPLGAFYIYPSTPATEGLARAVADNLATVDCRCIHLDDIAELTGEATGDRERVATLHAVGGALRGQGGVA